jgi:ABC-type arginine transport system permease subunit
MSRVLQTTCRKGAVAEVHKLKCTGTILNKYSTVARGLPNPLMVRLSRWGKRRLFAFNSHEYLLLMTVFYFSKNYII